MPSLLMLAMLAAAPGGAADDSPRDTPSSPDNLLLLRAAEQLLRETTFQARLRQQVELFGYTLTGSGTYLHKASSRGLLLRLEWKLAVDGQIANLQQVSDGRFLWVRRDLPGGATLGRVDLQRLQNTLEQAETGGGPPLLSEPLAFGLPRLLLNLNDNFVFLPPRDGLLGETRVWTTLGAWKSEKLASLFPRQSAPAATRDPRAELPAHVPTHVQVVIGQTDLVPYRIEYLRSAREPGPLAEDTRQPRFYRLATIELIESVRGEPLDDKLFFYQPGQQEVVDQTDLYLRNPTIER